MSTTADATTPLKNQQWVKEGPSRLTEKNLKTLTTTPLAKVNQEQGGTAVSEITVVGAPLLKSDIVAAPAPLVGGKSPPPNPISQGILTLLFVCFLYWVSTKILVFYGISNDIYLVYFMFYVFLYVTSLLLPTDYERFDST